VSGNGLNARMRAWLKQFPLVVEAKKRVDSLRHGSDYRICNSLPLFSPFSPGSYKDRARLTLQAANQTFPVLVRLLDGLKRNSLKGVDAVDFPEDDRQRDAALAIKRRLDHSGSNKANRHNYHLIYGRVLKDAERVTAVLEIGLGTNNTDVISNMGVDGVPGASLRAFRDYLPNARIYGADVDRRILFEETRIKTYFVDQTELQSLADLGEKIDEKLDLIIDDGLHSPHANVAVLAFALDRLKPGGWVIIEDIPESAYPLWEVVASVLPATFQPVMIRASDAFAFAVQCKPA
jgi:SAM-dependent methyltransferase